MTRLAFSLLPIAILFSGCAGPIETRVQTISSAQSFQPTGFQIFDVIAPNPQISAMIEQEIGQSLKAKGYQESEQAPVLLSSSIAVRPASIAIRLGEGKETRVVSDIKHNKPFQSCKDHEHRLIITMVQKDSGAQFYRGSASEYHCKADLKESLPHLVKAALSDLGDKGNGEISQKTLKRHGLD
ncbi:MAG: hypothetical protein Pars2KO_04260 [Parasphingorhabdus sp.]